MISKKKSSKWLTKVFKYDETIENNELKKTKKDHKNDDNSYIGGYTLDYFKNMFSEGKTDAMINHLKRFDNNNLNPNENTICKNIINGFLNKEIIDAIGIKKILDDFSIKPYYLFKKYPYMFKNNIFKWEELNEDQLEEFKSIYFDEITKSIKLYSSLLKSDIENYLIRSIQSGKFGHPEIFTSILNRYYIYHNELGICTENNITKFLPVIKGEYLNHSDLGIRIKIRDEYELGLLFDRIRTNSNLELNYIFLSAKNMHFENLSDISEYITNSFYLTPICNIASGVFPDNIGSLSRFYKERYLEKKMVYRI